MPAISTRKNRSTGYLVTVWDNREGDLAEHDGDEPWYSICEEHSQLISHMTRSLAQLHSVWPKGWCECCMGNEDHGGYYGCDACGVKGNE